MFEKNLDTKNKTGLASMIQPTDAYFSDSPCFEEICPICGDNHLHLIAVKCMRKSDETIVADDILIKEAVNNNRGSTITIEYSCECGGHNWEIVRQFHKGSTYVWCNVLTEKEASKGGLWRD